MEGRIGLRLPADLLATLEKLAEAEGRSLSNYIRWNLEQLAGKKKGGRK